MATNPGNAAAAEDGMAVGNALLAALQRQRDEALNRLAHTEANNTVLQAQNAALIVKIKEMEDAAADEDLDPTPYDEVDHAVS